ncbi:MAG TPA: hypothetical protein PL112_11635 [Candidatus Obscuribacter sp.]|nr:hypothetical protein [Candidatus Obscuribacter sp.]
MENSPASTSEEPAPAAAAAKASPLPNVGDLIFVGVCQLLLFMRPNYIFSDGSTGWHLVSGFHILNQHVIPRSDIFSFTFPGKTWVAYEWLSDAFMAWLVSLGGLNLLASVCAFAIAFLVLSLYQRMRSFGCHFAPAMLFSIIGLLASANHWLVRPHLFTFFGIYIFYTRLEDYYRGRLSLKWLFIWLLPTMLIWVNTHPAFLFAFAITGLYLCVTTGGVLLGRRSAREIPVLAGLLTALVLVSFINPYGMELYQYIREYLHGTAILAVTDEFRSPDFKHNLHAFFLEVLFACLLFGFYLRGRVTAASLAMCLAFGHLALGAVRNISLFAIVALPVLGQLYGSAAFTYLETSWLGKRLASMGKSTGEFNEQEGLSNFHFLPLLYCLVILVGSFSGLIKQSAGFDAESQPRETLTYIREHKLKPEKGFNLDNWGGILSYELSYPVFIDDRADFYGERFYQQYGQICETRPGWKESFDKLERDWVIFPKESSLVQALKQDSGWSVAAEDKASTLLVRKGR